MYKVIKTFHDLQDSKKTKSGEVYYEYKVGDTYPRKGLEPSKDRIAELAGKNNKQGTPLIKLVEDETPDGNKQDDEAPAGKSPAEEAPAETESTAKKTSKKTAAKKAE